jgi:hypothetical protein
MLPDIMTDTDFEMVKNDLVNLMVAKTKLRQTKLDTSSNKASASAFVIDVPGIQTKPKCAKLKRMFHGLNTKPPAMKNSAEEADDEVRRHDCRVELERYVRDATDGACPLYNEDESFNDPLKWWSVSGSKYLLVADLARIFLAIPATSAPSERIWSRAARILSLRRARLNDKLVSRMMFVKENAKFLHKHYCELAKQEREEHLHQLVGLELQYLPPLKEDAPLDVGKDD